MTGKMDFVVRALSTARQDGKHQREAGAADLPTLWSSSDQNSQDARDLVAEGLGIVVAGAIASHSLALDGSGGQVLASGVNLVVSTYNGAPILSTLRQLLTLAEVEPSKQSEAIAEIDREHNRKALEVAKTEYRLYRQGKVLPNAEHLQQLARRVARLEQGFSPVMLLENPLPGHLTVAVGNSPTSRWLVTYDDFGFSGLIDKARSVRGTLDIDLLIKSWHQQAFTAAYLEGIHHKPIPSPLVSVIIVALPETVANFLLSPNPLIAGLASCCWMIDGDRESHGSPVVSDWTEVIAKLAKRSRCAAGGMTHMNKQAVQCLFDFQDRMELALRQAPVESVGFLTQLPRLVSKISLNLQLMGNESQAQIMESQVGRAITRVELALNQRHGLMRTWREILDRRDFTKFCEVVLEKVVA